MAAFGLSKSEEITNKIFTIRGVQVMLDKDLASFYEVKPIRLREQIKRPQLSSIYNAAPNSVSFAIIQRFQQTGTA